ncbi:hypothetical protein PFISCL1PPCAC_23141, partial [Pristionchus fissidentatus]
ASILATLVDVPAVSVIDLRRSDEPTYTSGLSFIVLKVLNARCWYLDLGQCSPMTIADSLPMISKRFYFFARID